jgi:hypothetical protein
VAVARSDFGPFPPPHSATNKIEHKEPVLRMVGSWSGDQGEMSFDFTFKTDGTETTNQVGSAEIKSKGHWEGSVLVIESRITGDMGEATTRDKWTLSDDGKTLTEVRFWSSSQGDVNQTIVHERQ